MSLPRVQREMQEDGFWSLCPVHDIDTVLTNRYGANDTFSLLYCDLYLRQFKETLKQTMLEQESVFEDQIHELHRLYQRQKELMMEMEETNNLYSQPRHLLAGASSPRASLHWMGSSISTSKTSVLPPKDVSAKIDEAGFSGDESDKSGEKVLDLELLSYGYLDTGEEEEGSKNGEVHEVTNYPKDQSPRSSSFESVVQPENMRHLTDLSKCILDLNEPAKIEKHSDYELNQFLSPAQARSERAEPEAQHPLISTKSQAENGIDLNKPLSSEEEEEVTTFKTTESEKPQEFLAVSSHRKHGAEPSRAIVQALPCLKGISLFQKRSPWPRKKAKRRAKSTTVDKFPRRKARKGSNLDSNFSVKEDDNHSLSNASYIPESDNNQEQLEKGSLSSLPEVKSARNWTNTGKRRLRKPEKESGEVMRKIARTKSKTRGSFLVTEEEDHKKSAAAEAIIDMSLTDSARKSSIETSDCITPLRWFAKIASSVVEDSKSEVGLSVTGFHSDYQIDYFEAMTLQLTEIKPEEQRSNTTVSNIVHPKHKRTQRRQQQQHEDHHKEFPPSLSTFTGNEASEDLNKIETLIEAPETNVAHSSYCSLMENMVIDWGNIRKRRRGIRTRAANTKTTINFFGV